MNEIELEKIRIGNLRWRILHALWTHRPNLMDSDYLLTILNYQNLGIDRRGLEQELSHLKGKHLIKFHHKTFETTWLITIKPEGTDIIEYTTECPDGILRPPLLK